MTHSDHVLLSGFSDEVCRSKDLDLQFGVFAALGLRYVTLRFLRLGDRVKNVLDLSDSEVALVRERLDHYGLEVSSIGSPIGKVRLLPEDDGTENRYRPIDEYLSGEVSRGCQLARRFGTRLIRGFSFYHPRGSDAADHVPLAAAYLRQIAERCDAEGLTYGVEVEANLVGHQASRLLELLERVDHPALMLIFDGANLACQGYGTDQILIQWRQMLPHLGWVHVKDYRITSESVQAAPGGPIDEESLAGFVPVGRGDSGYREVFAELREALRGLAERLAARGIPGVFVDLEPHLLAGGQFGGYSSPAGMGVAVRAFCQLADEVGLPYQLRGFSPTKM